MGQFYNPTNITTAVLAGAGSFTQTPVIDVVALNDRVRGFGYTKLAVFAFASHASAASGFVIECSNDGVTWYTANSASVTANTPSTLEVALTFQYYRVKYTNGATLQTTFVLNYSLL